MSNDKPKAPAFVLGAALPQFTWTVRVPVPGNDDYAHAELPLTFQAVDQPELDELQNGGKLQADIVRRVVVGWPGLKDAHGSDVPFSPEALEKLMAAPMVRVAIVATYFAAMTGTAARKNA
ncbi:MAG: phage tail assembly chaperone [Roseateles sp.]